jgi:putative phosphoribosyl transferase
VLGTHGQRGLRPLVLGSGAECVVRAGTLRNAGGADYGVIELNEEAAARRACEHEVAIVPAAAHLFEEAGALAAVVELVSG